MSTIEEVVAKYKEDKARKKKADDGRKIAALKSKIEFDFDGRHFGPLRMEQLGLTYYPDRAEFVFKSVVHTIAFSEQGCFRLSYPQTDQEIVEEMGTTAWRYPNCGELRDTIMTTLGAA